MSKMSTGKMLRWFVFTSLLLVSLAEELVCPSGCTCQEDEKTLTIVCVASTAYDPVPSVFPHHTTSLRLENFHIMKLADFKSPLPHLRSLAIIRCHIPSLDGLYFGNLPELVELDLRNNYFETLPMLQGTEIEVLNLGHNEIKHVNMSGLGYVPTLKELHLDYNNIETVKVNGIFMNLKKLTLSNNNISDISAALRNLTFVPRLHVLNLANNSLENLGGFPKLSFLEYLDVSNNSLSQIEDNTFLNLTSLLTLNLQRNMLLSVPHGLPLLENLDLSYNQIIHILEVQKPELYPVEIFNFAHNPLHCDCHILWLKELYDQREYLLKHIPVPAKEFIPTCASPLSLAGEGWDQLGDSVFTCDASSHVKGGKPDLVIKSGKVTGDMIEVFWSWTVKGPLAYSTVYIQYYVFGLRAETKRHVQVALAQRQYTLKNLRPTTNYLVCIVPRDDEQITSEIPQPQSLDDCLEILTKDGTPIEVLSIFYIIMYYFLTMAATIIAIFAMIGLIALLYGLYSSKSDWSAKYVPIDEPVVDRKEDENVRKESENRGTENKETENKETERKETDNREAERKETDNREAENKDTEIKETENREAERKETENEETRRKETENIESEGKDMDNKKDN